MTGCGGRPDGGEGDADGPATLVSSQDAGNANPNNLFRYGAALGGYIFNLGTKGLGAGAYNFYSLALRWNDVDFGAGMIRLVDESTSRRTRGKRETRTLKGGRGRSFPINDELRPALEAIARHPDGYVFRGPAGGRLKADTVRRAFVRDVLTPLAGQFPAVGGEVGFADGRLHSFRHFFCSLCASRGVAQQVVMRWLGHKESKMVEHYFHLHDEEARRQMRRIVLSDDTGGA